MQLLTRRPVRIVTWLLTLSISGCVTLAGSDEPFEQGAALLAKATEHDQESRKKILEASSLRKQLSSLHAKSRKTKDDDKRKELAAFVSTLTANMDTLQQDGADLRVAAAKAKAKAVDQYRLGMSGRWADWVKSQEQLSTADHGLGGVSRAHNPRIASADPSVIRRQAAVRAAEALKEQNAPADLDLGTFQISRERRMVGHVEVAASGAGIVPLNEIHSWRLIVSDTEGRPVDETFKVLGHMPGHVHGLPTQPVVTKRLAPGVYLVEGLKFQMRGWWVMEFDSGSDRLRFNIVL